MNRTSIELGRVTNYPYGYGRMRYPVADDDEVLARLIGWTRANPAAKVYKHKVVTKHENIGAPGSYKSEDSDWSSGKAPHTSACDVVDYLDIYWQT